VRILLVEDEPQLAAALAAALARHRAVVDHVPSLAAARAALVSGVHDAVLLDRQLPDGDGLTLLPELRAARVDTPVIVLTARGGLEDRVSGLEHGADDYLAKPFAVEEVMARLRAVLRRPGRVAADVLRLGRLCFDPRHREASIDGVPLLLPRRELLVLEALLQRHGRTVLRASLEEAVFGFDDAVQPNALDTHVSRLRGKLAPAGLEIHGIRGVGYLLREAPA
jgi:DNA-binding response OmpR family regulator